MTLAMLAFTMEDFSKKATKVAPLGKLIICGLLGFIFFRCSFISKQKMIYEEAFKPIL